MKFRLQNGVDKITNTKGLVSNMQQELKELQPVLAKTQQEVTSSSPSWSQQERSLTDCRLHSLLLGRRNDGEDHARQG